MFDTLKENKSTISFLSLTQNNLDDEFMKSLGQYIQDNRYLVELNVAYNQISDKGIAILSDYMMEDVVLEKININGNRKVTDASIPVLIKMIESSHIGLIRYANTSIKQTKALNAPLFENGIKHGIAKVGYAYL